MTALQPIINATGSSVFEGGLKSWLTDLRVFLAGLFGTDGTKVTARKTLLEPGDSGKFYRSNGATSDPTWETLPSGGASCFFRGYGTYDATNATGDGTYCYFTGGEAFDIENCYSASSSLGQFTAPSNGYYMFNVSVNWGNAEQSEFYFTLFLGAEAVGCHNSDSKGSMTLSSIVYLSATSTLYPAFVASGGSKTVDRLSYSFSGCKLG
ncbi:MAG: hypothetical protein HQL95_01685 [Magnetococcales bacterium]|nr:hypothetical protein [Magnetococcales bacterium]